MPDKTPAANILGYSLKHYAIVQVEGKSKKGSVAGKKAAILAVENADASWQRCILGAQFTGSSKMGTGDKQCENWVVEYVRASVDALKIATQG